MARVGTMLVFLATVTACGSGTATPVSSGEGSVGNVPTGSTGASSLTSAEAIARYGNGPQPGAVTYQPDVVLIGGGPGAIRRVSPDGIVWTIDANAAGARDLAPGKVMFASSDAVGRVATVERQGDVIAVSLRPVALGEVIAEGDLKIDQHVPIDTLELIDVPQIAEAAEDVSIAPQASSIGLARYLPPTGLHAPGSSNAADAGELSKKVGDWDLTAYRRAGSLGLKAQREAAGGGLMINLDASLDVGDLEVVADVPISRGEVGQSHFEVNGITGLHLSIEGGAGNGLSDNRKARIELPIQLKERVIIGGFPATLTQKFKFLVETSFTAKNGNLTAQGTWSVDGPLGFDGTTLTTPTITQTGDKLVDSIAGVSVGLNAVVAAVAFEFGLIIGLPIAGAGPMVNFTTSLGLTNGSSLGIVQCRQATITSVLTAGVGISVFDPIKKALKKLYSFELPEQKTFVTKTIVQESWYTPNVVACKL